MADRHFGPTTALPPQADTGGRLAKATYCICGAFCRGDNSADWATCAPGCSACRPDPWQEPSRSPAVGDDLNTRDS